MWPQPVMVLLLSKSSRQMGQLLLSCWSPSPAAAATAAAEAPAPSSRQREGQPEASAWRAAAAIAAISTFHGRVHSKNLSKAPCLLLQPPPQQQQGPVQGRAGRMTMSEQPIA